MPLRQGEMIGAYQIVAPLGQGGTATVYRAYHARLNRYVAVKMIHQAYLEDANFLARFEREAQIIAALEHPHIVPVYDFSEHAGEPYLVMKLIEGSTVKARIAQQPLSTDEILALLTPVASALDYAHRCGVLHRDIKPSNIMLDAASAPYLTDFGLARVALAEDTTGSQDMLLGTPHYISPEQALGKGEIDHRSDLYSLGVVLYELLVGEVPFSGGTPYSIINDHIYQPLPLPSSLNPDVSPPVEAVLLRALSKSPADRYQTATDLIDAYREALHSARRAAAESDTQPLEILPPRPPLQPPAPSLTPAAPATPAAKPARRNYWFWLLWIISAGAAGAISALVVSSLTMPNRPAQLPPQPPPEIALYDVPVLSLEAASAALAASPRDPVAYLALIRAQLLADDLPAARRSVSEGFLVAGGDPRFELTAADLAVQAGRSDAAFILYADAINRAQATPNEASVRAVAGEALYLAASAAERLRAPVLTELIAQLQDTNAPLVTTMIARALLANGNVRLAQVRIADAISAAPDLAETQLVSGEIQRQLRSQQAARAAWQRVQSSPDAPQWVRNRAAELLNALAAT